MSKCKNKQFMDRVDRILDIGSRISLVVMFLDFIYLLVGGIILMSKL